MLCTGMTSWCTWLEERIIFNTYRMTNVSLEYTVPLPCTGCSECKVICLRGGAIKVIAKALLLLIMFIPKVPYIPYFNDYLKVRYRYWWYYYYYYYYNYT